MLKSVQKNRQTRNQGLVKMCASNKVSYMCTIPIQSETVKKHTHTYNAFFPNELHNDSALVTSGELHQMYEHQVEFSVASRLGALLVGWGSQPRFTQIPHVLKSLLRCRWKRVESCHHLRDLVLSFHLKLEDYVSFWFCFISI